MLQHIPIDTISMIALLTFGLALGYLLRKYLTLAKVSSAEFQAIQIKLDAETAAQTILREAQDRASQTIHDAETRADERERESREIQIRLAKREEFLDRRQTDLDREIESIKIRSEKTSELQIQATEVLRLRTQELENVAHLTQDEAIRELHIAIERDYQEDLTRRIHRMETENKEALDERARDIMVTAMQRLASSTAQDVTTTSVVIPSEDVKGKIIGKEGRNIKAFERSSGVELIIDDAPNLIIISSFDPVRRQIARVALENLILDGRIQPAKIEEFLEGAKQDINRIIKEKGEQAAFECGVYNLDPRVLAILGRLYFRTSYGQNVLQHSVEMAHLAGMIAQELNADVVIAKSGALVHDIGKALDHEFEGGHLKIGMKVLEKFGTDPRIITAMKSHHEDFPHESIESVIVTVADKLSGARPGARRDSAEQYIKRLGDLENAAKSFPGIDQAYALSAGREIRVFVRPTEVDDYEAKQLARNIANKIESELRYPGEIRITVIRENRVIEFAR